MSSRILYQDRAVALTSDAVVVRGFTKLFGRARRIDIGSISSFRVRQQSDFPDQQMPPWGVNDDGVWYTRDRRRFRRHVAIELTFANNESVGFTPAHGLRFRDLLLQLNVKER